MRQHTNSKGDSHFKFSKHVAEEEEESMLHCDPKLNAKVLHQQPLQVLMD
jgi:hypothetical protein